jgi:hypothetical protein
MPHVADARRAAPRLDSPAQMQSVYIIDLVAQSRRHKIE